MVLLLSYFLSRKLHLTLLARPRGNGLKLSQLQCFCKRVVRRKARNQACVDKLKDKSLSVVEKARLNQLWIRRRILRQALRKSKFFLYYYSIVMLIRALILFYV